MTSSRICHVTGCSPYIKNGYRALYLRVEFVNRNGSFRSIEFVPDNSIRIFSSYLRFASEVQSGKHVLEERITGV